MNEKLMLPVQVRVNVDADPRMQAAGLIPESFRSTGAEAPYASVSAVCNLCASTLWIDEFTFDKGRAKSAGEAVQNNIFTLHNQQQCCSAVMWAATVPPRRRPSRPQSSAKWSTSSTGAKPRV